VLHDLAGLSTEGESLAVPFSL